MSPEQNKIQELERKVMELTNFMKSFNTAAQIPPQVAKTIIKIVGNIKLSDLIDVEGTDSATAGQVLKKTATTWQPGTDIDT